MIAKYSFQLLPKKKERKHLEDIQQLNITTSYWLVLIVTFVQKFILYTLR